MKEWFAWHWKTIAWGVGIIALAASYACFYGEIKRQDFEEKSTEVRLYCLDLASKNFDLELYPDKSEAVPSGTRFVNRMGVTIVWKNRAGKPDIKCIADFIQAKPRIILFEIGGINVTNQIR